MEASATITFEHVLTLVKQLSMSEQMRLLEWIIQQIKQSFGLAEPTSLRKVQLSNIKEEPMSQVKMEQTARQLHQQALAYLAPYPQCDLATRLLEPQISKHAELWASARTYRTDMRQLFGVDAV